MSDLISRQAAIDAIRREIEIPGVVGNTMLVFYAKVVKERLERLPSAEPEIVRCKDCKCWTRTVGDNQWSLGDCNLFDKHLVMCNGFCAWAERRKDG